MKLTLRLPFAFCSALLLMLAAALYGIHSLSQLTNVYATTVQESRDHATAADGLLIAFKTQVQEWKNVLLRGHDPAALDKHWTAFNATSRDVTERAKALLATLPDGDVRDDVAKFAAAHVTMDAQYRRGSEAFKASGFDATVGDTAVRGIDREPAKLLDKASTRLALRSAAAASEANTNTQRATLVSVVLMVALFCMGVVGSVLFSRSITRPILQAVGTAHAVAGGDLTPSASTQGRDEIADLVRALEAMRGKLAAVVSTVRNGSESVATASEQIAQGNLDLSQRTEQQSSNLQATTASMDQLSSMVKDNANYATQASHLALDASSAAVRGGDVIGQVVETMNSINDSSKTISEITSVIDGIAFQTNILALNAAVEAARAGENGRGFAVVAGEVRQLAQRSAESSKEIKRLITTSVERVAHGTLLVDRAGNTMQEIVDAIGRVSDIVAKISGASTEQSVGMGRVGVAIAHIDQATQQNAALVEQSAAAADSLKTQALQLVDVVAVFKLQSRLELQPT